MVGPVRAGAWVISIHAPREGGDLRWALNNRLFSQFQSTPPARGATAIPHTIPIPFFEFQSTPPARGATAKLHRDGVNYLCVLYSLALRKWEIDRFPGRDACF